MEVGYRVKFSVALERVSDSPGLFSSSWLVEMKDL